MTLRKKRGIKKEQRSKSRVREKIPGGLNHSEDFSFFLLKTSASQSCTFIMDGTSVTFWPSIYDIRTGEGKQRQKEETELKILTKYVSKFGIATLWNK